MATLWISHCGGVLPPACGSIITAVFTSCLPRHYSVTTASTAVEALRLLEEAQRVPGGRQFDLVLTDLKMPEVSGFDLIQEVVAGRNGIRNIPVVVMSSEDSRDSVMQVRLAIFLIYWNNICLR